MGRILAYLIELAGAFSQGWNLQGSSEDLSHESLWASRVMPMAPLQYCPGFFPLPWLYRDHLTGSGGSDAYALANQLW